MVEDQNTNDNPVEDKKITKLGFRNRFTLEEKVAIEMASLDDTSADMSERIKSATVRAYLQDIASASFIDLSRSDTRGGVIALETMGIIAVGRALEILDTPVHEIEKYRG